MDFLEFKNRIPKVNKIPLEGKKAHEKMLPNLESRHLLDEEIQKRNPENAGVVALFYPDMNNETRIMLILRKTYKGVHSAQIGFPGGREELKDDDIQATAIRETYEEIGVRTSNINLLCPLSKVYIPPSNFWLYPFLAITKSAPKFSRQESEVEELIPVKLTDLLDDSKFGPQIITSGSLNNMEVPAFCLNNQIVWGATGMVLNEIKSLLNKTL